ncbi:MAG: sigma-E processing peptidase SpoIIGA [Anaeroplasmataceae bacterium]
MYIEIIVLINIIIHIITSYSVAFIINTKIKKLNIAISTILDSIYMVIYVLFPEYTLYIKYLFGSVLAIITFSGAGIKAIIRSVILYNAINFLAGGKAFLLYEIGYLNNVTLISIFVVLFIGIYFYKMQYKVTINIDQLFYKLEIINDNKRLLLDCYLDTGDFLVCDDLVNIIFINKKYEMGRYIKKQYSKSVGVVSEISLYMVDKIYLYINNKKYKKIAYIAYMDLPYDGIFGISFLGG